MGAQYRSHTSTYVPLGTSSGNATIPADVADGDLLLLFVGSSSGTDGATVPAGWNRYVPESGFMTNAWWRWATANDAGSSVAISGLNGANWLVVVACTGAISPVVHDVREDSFNNGTTRPTTLQTGSITTNRDEQLVVQFVAARDIFDAVVFFSEYPSTLRQRRDDGHVAFALCDENQPNAGESQPRTFTAEGNEIEAITVAIMGNVAPNAPILTAPTDGTTINRNNTNRFTLTASDPDGAGDSVSQTDWRYRLDGTATWTTVSKISPNTFYDFAPGTFTLGLHEWQARTYDAQGEVGPWSSSSFFTAADAPDQPTFTDPINGQTIGLASYTGTISAPDVDESEWTLYADNAGAIDTATVVQGPVTKTTGDLRSHTFTGLENNTVVWWSVRTKFEGLWSQPAQIRTPISYTPPPNPTHELTPVPTEGVIVVGITNPTPVEGEPALSYNNVWVADPGKPLERRATYLTGNQPWIYHTPVSGYRYDGTDGTRILVEAVASNGTTSWSGDPTIADPPADGFYYGGGGY